jgi:hypothetical protein
MKIELEREDLLNMVKGTSPYYSVMEDTLVKKAGQWIGGMADRWSWGDLNSLTDEELFKLYKICKDSWK